MNINYLTISRLALLYIVIWCISPPLSYGTIYRLIALTSIAVLILINLLTDTQNKKIWYFCVLCLILYMLLVAYVVGDGINYRIGTYIFLCIMLASQVLWNKKFDVSKFYFFIPTVFLLLIIWNFKTLQGIAEVPNIMRLLAKNSDISMYYARQGVGGYGYLYTIVIMLPIGLDCMLKRGNKILYRILAAVFVFTSYFVIFQSQYFLGLLLSILITVLYVVFSCENRLFRIVAIIILSIAFIYMYTNADKVLLFLRDTIDIRSIQLKIDSMYNLIVNDGEIADTEFYTRYDRYVESFIYALSHPFFGGFSYNVTGNHSHILDFFAQFGVLVGIVYLSIILKSLKKVSYNKYAAGIVSLNAFFLVTLMNTISYSFAVIIFILVPIYYFYLIREEK